MSERGESKAMNLSAGGWGEVGSAEMTRYSKPIPVGHNRRKSKCRLAGECPNRCRATGFANGVALCSGCEFHIAAWVRDGYTKPQRAASSSIPGDTT